jgi:hypothetical protein
MPEAESFDSSLLGLSQSFTALPFTVEIVPDEAEGGLASEKKEKSYKRSFLCDLRQFVLVVRVLGTFLTACIFGLITKRIRSEYQRSQDFFDLSVPPPFPRLWEM